MKRYYYFVRRMVGFSVQDIIYKVSVGSSNREQMKHELVKCFAADCGIYYQPVSDTSDAAVEHLVKSICCSFSISQSPVRMIELNICDLYRVIMDDSFDLFENSLPRPRGYNLFRRKIDPVFYFKSQKSKSSPKLPSSQRKYLKSVQEESMNSFLINSVIIIIIFLVAGYFEGHYGY